MGFFSTTRKVTEYGASGAKTGGFLEETSDAGIQGLLTKGLFVFMGYLFLAGVVGWSKQMMWLLIILGAIWWLSR